MAPFDVRTVTGEWDYGALPPNVRLGRDCCIEHPETFARFRSTRDPGVELGDRVRVYGWTVFNVEPSGAVVVGEDSVLVGAVFMCQEEIPVGRGTVVSYQVTIADTEAPRPPDGAPEPPAGDIEIGENAWVGARAVLLAGTRIGADGIVGAGAVVAGEVPAGATVAGNPARMVRPGER